MDRTYNYTIKYLDYSCGICDEELKTKFKKGRRGKRVFICLIHYSCVRDS